MKKRIAIYARVSTNDQDLQAQVSRLENWIVEVYAAKPENIRKTIFSDVGSGARANRPGLLELRSAIVRHSVDLILVESLDRLSRSLRELLLMLDDVNAAGINFVSLRETIDTRTAAGKLHFHLIAAFAQFERERIAERVRSGLDTARRRGIVVGRPGIPLETLSRIHELHAAKSSIREIATELSISPTTVQKYLPKKLGPEL